MGKEIVYCVECGTGLYEDDFRKGRARMVNDRPYCAACAPATPETPAPPSRSNQAAVKPGTGPIAIAKSESTRARKSPTGRIPLATPPGTGRRPAPAPAPVESSTNPTLIVGGIVIAVVVIIIAVVMAGSSSHEAARSYPPPDVERPAYRPPPQPRDRETSRPTNPGPLPPADVLRELERNVQHKKPEEILALCEKARPTLKGTPQEDRLRQIEEEARFAKIEPALNRIQQLIREDPAFKRRTDIQIQINSALGAAGGRSPQLEQLKADYERRYEETAARQAESTRAEAERLVGENKLNDAIRKCDEFMATFASSAEGESIKKLRAELEAKKNK